VVLQHTDSENFNDLIANEYLAIIYAMWIYFNEFTFTIEFDPNKDKETFGEWLVRDDYTATVFATVSLEGDYTICIKHEFKHSHEREILMKNQSFSESFTKKGNIKDWISTKNQVKETVHEQYRTKKIIPITNLQSS
jgi:hypothetical protein